MLKQIVGVVAVILTFIGYIPYSRDIISGKTKPHIFSWFLWGFVTSIAFALQIYGKAGTGAYVTLSAALMCFVVLFLGLKHKSTSDITKTDVLFMVAALVALGVWVFAKQPVLSTILTTLIDLFAFAPTIRKSWNKPFTETLSFYYLNTFRFGLAIISLGRYTILTSLYPITWLTANGVFAILLLVRRYQIGKVKY